jgi:ketosteroid isomerase-like protein
MPADNAEVVRRWWAALSESGMPPLELCDEAIEITMFAGFPVQGPYRGHEGVRQYAEQTFDVVEDLRIVLDDVIEADDGETVVSAQRALGTTRHTRMDVDFPWAVVWAIRDGRVVHAQGFATKEEALKVAGLAR